MSLIDDMFFTLTDCNKTKYHQFLTIEIIQTQIVKHCWPIDDFFNLTCKESINLSNYRHTKNTNKII